ncbi:hypothetical protein M9458_008399 [Cirrhinus mrigala]|uniref:B30.2/SPRY domain-containing protein n=1 Tax=Cirrhinus mrigala TaxID=683832 RepID=A0ABD0R8H2_CIRMR
MCVFSSLDHGGESRITAGLKKYACFLTLDPNTANTELRLSEENRKVTRVKENQSYPDHPDRFDKESVCGRCYWEIECSGDDYVFISVSYKSISRKGDGDECVFGHNDHPFSYSFIHNNIKTDPPVTLISRGIGVNNDFIYRIGVYVDESAGTLSFYCNRPHSLRHSILGLGLALALGFMFALDHQFHCVDE